MAVLSAFGNDNAYGKAKCNNCGEEHEDWHLWFSDDECCDLSAPIPVTYLFCSSECVNEWIGSDKFLGLGK